MGIWATVETFEFARESHSSLIGVPAVCHRIFCYDAVTEIKLLVSIIEYFERLMV